jgi:RNA methyltransferase, TrmH family
MPLSKAELQNLRDLREKKHRTAAARFVVENPKVLAELLAAGHAFETIYATAAELARASHLPTPSGVVAVGRISNVTLEPGELTRGLTLALDGIQDPGNVGTLLRIADWFGFARVLLSPESADLFSQKVINASMGSFARVRAIATELAPVLAETARAGVPVLGCDLAGESVHALAPLANGVVVIGSEGRGPSPAVREHVSRWITIPRHGGAESLNAAVAAGIVCAALRRG